jgi:hypothetical protein
MIGKKSNYLQAANHINNYPCSKIVQFVSFIELKIRIERSCHALKKIIQKKTKLECKMLLLLISNTFRGVKNL